MSTWDAAARAWIRQRVSPSTLVTLRCLTRGLPRPRWGNLRRRRPFSDRYGFERGTPLDRYYLHRFLEQHRAAITGNVLEIQMPGYTRQYGRGVTTADSFDIAPGPGHAPTYVVDLAKAAGVIPDDAYDCLLLPNTLSVLRDLEGCLTQALRVVRPGGTILAAGAVFVPLTTDYPDYWRLTGDGWREVTARVWPGCDVEITQHGNLVAAMAALLGLALEELTPDELDVQDPRYPVAVTIACRKPA